MTINRDDWLKALASAAPEIDDSAMTTREVGALLGLSSTAAKDRVRKLVTEGRARVTNKRITDTGGRTQIVRAYKLVDASPKLRRA